MRERVRVKAEEQRAKMEEPTAIRLRDKLSFMLGVVGCFVIEACVLQAPQLYPYLSRVKGPPLAGPELGSCASSRRAWRLWAARHSQEEAGPLAPSHCLGCSS